MWRLNEERGTTALEGGHIALFLLNIWYLVFLVSRGARFSSEAASYVARAIGEMSGASFYAFSALQSFAVLVYRHTRLRTRLALSHPIIALINT